MIDTAAYLRRIGMPDDDAAHSYAFLSQLQYRHVLSVPYENMDILAGIPLSLDSGALQDKIVRRHRGGYCFELNGAFSDLLKALGFEVKNYFARFLRGETEIPLRRHRVLVTEIEGRRYLCDVGIGQSAPRYPLLLQEDILQEQFGETYRFSRDPFLGWVLWDLHRGEWRRFFSFTEEEQLDIDFTHASFYCEKHPDSPFNKALSVSIKTDTGRKTVNGRSFKVFCGDEVVREETLNDDTLLRRVLREEFGLEMDV